MSEKFKEYGYVSIVSDLEPLNDCFFYSLTHIFREIYPYINSKLSISC